MLEELEMYQDIRDYNSVKAALERGEEVLIPGEVTFALLDVENPLKVWREYRGLTRQQLMESNGR